MARAGTAGTVWKRGVPRRALAAALCAALAVAAVLAAAQAASAAYTSVQSSSSVDCSYDFVYYGDDETGRSTVLSQADRLKLGTNASSCKVTIASDLKSYVKTKKLSDGTKMLVVDYTRYAGEEVGSSSGYVVRVVMKGVGEVDGRRVDAVLTVTGVELSEVYSETYQAANGDPTYAGFLRISATNMTLGGTMAMGYGYAGEVTVDYDLELSYGNGDELDVQASLFFKDIDQVNTFGGQTVYEKVRLTSGFSTPYYCSDDSLLELSGKTFRNSSPDDATDAGSADVDGYWFAVYGQMSGSEASFRWSGGSASVALSAYLFDASMEKEAYALEDGEYVTYDAWAADNPKETLSYGSEVAWRIELEMPTLGGDVLGCYGSLSVSDTLPEGFEYEGVSVEFLDSETEYEETAADSSGTLAEGTHYEVDEPAEGNGNTLTVTFKKANFLSLKRYYDLYSGGVDTDEESTFERNTVVVWVYGTVGSTEAEELDNEAAVAADGHSHSDSASLPVATGASTPTTISVEKAVDGGSPANPGREFQFTVRVEGSASGPAEGNRMVYLYEDGEYQEGDPVTFSGGEATLTLAAGQTAVVCIGEADGDGETYSYSVEEDPPGGGWGDEPSWEGEPAGDAEFGSTDSWCRATNSYSAEGSWEPDVSKYLNSGTGWLANDSFADGFSFVLAEADEDFEAVEGGQTWTAESATDGTTSEVAFEAISHKLGGGDGDLDEADFSDGAVTYRFLLWEVTDPDAYDGEAYADVVWDETVYRVTVTFADDGEGTLEATASYEPVGNGTGDDDATATSAEFYNETPTGLAISKVVEGATEAEDGDLFGFSVEIESAGTEGAAYAVEVVDSSTGESSEALVSYGDGEPAAASSVESGAVVWLEAGQRARITGLPVGAEWTVEEVSSPGWYAASRTGALSGTTTLGTVSTAQFTNVYSASGSVSLAAAKAVSGGYPDVSDAAGLFSASAYEVVDGEASKSSALTARASADGSIALGEIAYTQADAGTHVYKIVEEAGSEAGWTYDGSAYYARVVVVDDGDGTLSSGDGESIEATYWADEACTEALPDADGDGQADDVPTFVNSYEASGAWSPVCYKELTGGSLSDYIASYGSSAFAFGLYSDAACTELVAAAAAAADGSVVFDGAVDLDVSMVGGTYTYYVKEVVPGEGSSDDIAAVVYDDSVLKVTITVADDGAGTLYAAEEWDPADRTVSNGLEPGTLVIQKYADEDSDDYDPSALFGFYVSLYGDEDAVGAFDAEEYVLGLIEED